MAQGGTQPGSPDPDEEGDRALGAIQASEFLLDPKTRMAYDATFMESLGQA